MEVNQGLFQFGNFLYLVAHPAQSKATPFQYELWEASEEP